MNEQKSLKKLLRQQIKRQLRKLDEENQPHNDSHVYIESSTLNLFVLYLLLNMEKRPNQNERDQGMPSLNTDELINDVNAVMLSNNQAFQEIIELLKT